MVGDCTGVIVESGEDKEGAAESGIGLGARFGDGVEVTTEDDIYGAEKIIDWVYGRPRGRKGGR